MTIPWFMSFSLIIPIYDVKFCRLWYFEDYHHLGYITQGLAVLAHNLLHTNNSYALVVPKAWLCFSFCPKYIWKCPCSFLLSILEFDYQFKPIFMTPYFNWFHYIRAIGGNFIIQYFSLPIVTIRYILSLRSARYLIIDSAFLLL